MADRQAIYTGAEKWRWEIQRARQAWFNFIKL
jgi:hypothetical protein